MEEKDWNQILADFSATKEAKPNLSEEEWFEKFPEFNNDGNMLQAAFDYDATVKSGKYKDDQATLQSKFPEFWGTSNATQPQSTPTQPTPQAAQQPNEYAQKMSYNPYGEVSAPYIGMQATPTEEIPEQYRDAYSKMSPAEQRVFSKTLARKQQMETPEGRSKAAQDMRDVAGNMKRRDPRRKQLLERADALDHSEDALRTPDEMRALQKKEEDNEKNKKLTWDEDLADEVDYSPEYYATKKEAQRIKDEQYRAIEGRAVAMGKHTDNYTKGSDIYRDATDIFDQTDEGKVYNAKLENSIQLDRDDFAMSMLNSDDKEMREVAQMYSKFGDIEREGRELAAINESLKQRAETLDTTNEDAVNKYNADVKAAQKRYDAYLKQIEEYDKLRKSGAFDKYNEAFQEYITENDESATRGVLQEKNDAMTAMFGDWIDRKSIPLKKQVSKDFTDEIEKRINERREESADVPIYMLNNPMQNPLGISGRKTESGALTTAAQYTKKAQDLISNDNQNIYANSLTKGFVDTAGDMDFWTFGMNEAVRGFISKDIMNKVVAGKEQLSEDERRAYDSAVEKGYKNLTPEEEAATEKAAQLGRENLNEDEKLAYDAMQNYWQVQQLFKQSGWYTAGQVTAEALPFIVAMWGSGGIVNIIKGGAKGAEKVALRQAAKQAEKMTFKQATKQAAKNVGKAAGNMALEGAVYASTTGLPHTVAGTLEYLMPQSNATYDLEEGGIKVNRLEESDESVLSAAAKSWGTQMIEGMSEAFSTYGLEPMEAAAYARLFGKTAEEMAKGGNRAYKDIVRAAFKKGSMGDGIFRNVSSFPNEYIEELFGGFLRCITGLSEWDKEFSGETLAQTAYGLLPMQVVFSAMGGGNLRKHRQRMRQAEQFLNEFSPDSKALYDKLSGMSTYEGQDLLDREILSIQQEVDALKKADKFTPEMQQKMAARMNMALVMKEQLYMDEAAATIKEEQQRNAYEAATSNLNEQNGNLVYAEYKDEDGNYKRGWVISQDGENTVISDGKKRFKVKSADVTELEEYTMEEVEDHIIGEGGAFAIEAAEDIANPIAGQDYYDHRDDTPLVLEGGGMLHVDEVDDDGNVTFTLNGRQATVSRRQFRDIVQQSRNNMEYAEADIKAFNEMGQGKQKMAVMSEDPMLNAQLGRRGRDARAYLAEAVGEDRVRQMEQMDGKDLARAYAEADAVTKKLMQNWMELGGYDMGRTYEEAINERVNEAANQQYKLFEEFALGQDKQTSNRFNERGDVTTATLDGGERVIVGTNDGNEAVVMDMNGNMQMVSPTRLTDMGTSFAMSLARQTTQGVAQQMQALQMAFNGTAFAPNTEYTISVNDDGKEDKAIIVQQKDGTTTYATEYHPEKDGTMTPTNRSLHTVTDTEFRDMVEGAQRKTAMQQARRAAESKAVADQGIVKDGQDVTVMSGGKPVVGKYVFNAGHHFVVDAEGKVIGDFKSMDELKASMQEAQAAAKAGEQMEREAELVEQSEMEKEYQRRLDEAKTTKERAAVIQEYLDQIKTEDFTMITNDNIVGALVESMVKRGIKQEDAIRLATQIQSDIQAANNSQQRVRGFNHPYTGICIHPEDIVSIEDARTTYVHERQHTITRNNVSLQAAVLQAASKDELDTYITVLSGSPFYKGKDNETVASEFLSMAMEVAYKSSDVGSALRQLGIENDALIQIITQLDNEQRTDEHLSKSRRTAHVDGSQQGDNRNDDENKGREPGQMDGQGSRPIQRGGEPAGSRQEVKTPEQLLEAFIAKHGDNTENKLNKTIESISGDIRNLEKKLATAEQELKDLPEAYNDKAKKAIDKKEKFIEKVRNELEAARKALAPYTAMKEVWDGRAMANQTRLNEADQALQDLDTNLNPTVEAEEVHKFDKEPANADEAAADFLVGFVKKEYRINEPSLMQETGWSEDEVKNFRPATTPDGGMTLQKAAENLYNEYESEGSEHGWFKDPSEARDKLISVMQEAGKYGELANYINQRRGNDAATQQMQAALDYNAQQLGYADAQDMHDKRMAEAQAKLEELKDPQGNLSEEALQQFKDFTQGLMIGQEETPAEQPTESIEGGEEFIQPTNEEAPFSVVLPIDQQTPKNTTIDQVLYSIKVNHNSPYLLKRADGSFIDPETGERLGFDHRFMNTGEGAQVHGWGSYFSVEDLRNYADDLGNPKTPPMRAALRQQGRKWLEENPTFEAWKETKEFKDYYYNHEDSAFKYIEELKTRGPEWQADIEDIEKRIEERRRQREDEDYLRKQYNIEREAALTQSSRHHYDVEIPDNDNDYYLEEDGVLSVEDNAILRNELEKEILKRDEDGAYKGHENDLVEELKAAFPDNITGRDAYGNVSTYLGGDEQASKFLKEMGYYGIHYDGQRDGECYVIFDENDARIVDHVRFSVVTPNGQLDNERLNDIIQAVQSGQGSVSRIPSGLRQENESVPAIAAQAIAKGLFASKLARNGQAYKDTDVRNERGTGRGVAERVPELEPQNLFGIKGIGEQDREEVRNLIKQWAKENGYWFDEERLQQMGDEMRGGTESRVFRSEDGTTISKSTNAFNYEGNVQLVIESMEMFGKVFPNTPYTIIGFAEDKNGNLCVVATQPYVQGMSIDEYAKQNDWFDEYGNVDYDKKMDFLNRKMNEQYGLDLVGAVGAYENDTYHVFDIHSGNYIVDNNGDISVIDADISLNNESDYLDDGVRFSVVTPQQDADYMDAVQSGDMETAQRMVNKAARQAGYEYFGMHGTRGEFTVFDKKKIGSANDEGWLGRGFYFWDKNNRYYANQYASGGKVMNVFLSLQEPYPIEKEEIERLIEASDNHDIETIEEFTQDLIDNGYDGVVDDGGQMVVFNPNQIKSADPVTYDDQGNVIPLSERFNEGNDDIRYSITKEQDEAFRKAYDEGDTEAAMQMVREAAAQAMPNTKVVDENGLPLVVYHGRSEQFNTFERRKGVRFVMGLEDEVESEGFFFTPNKDFAEQYAANAERRRGGRRETIPTFLNIENPLDLAFTDNFAQLYEEVTGYEYQLGMDDITNLWEIMDIEGMADKIKAKGYDGVIFAEERAEDGTVTEYSYCVFDPNQIKSAEPFTFDDNGELIPLSERFNPNNDDIRYSVSSAAKDVLDKWENQDGSSDYPYLTNDDLVDMVDENEYLNSDDKLALAVYRYRKLKQEDYEEGMRDYSGGEADDLVENEIIPRIKELANNDIRYSIVNEQGELNYEELDNIIRGQRNELAGLSRIPEEAVGRAVATPAIAAEAIARGVRQANLAEVWGEDRAREHTRELIKQWAKQSGHWYDEARLTKDATEGRGGTESRVFVTNNGETVRKLTSPVFSQGDVEPYIESLHLFGNVFGESAYDIKGFGENDKGELCVVVEQPYIQGVRLSDSGITKSLDKIREFMESLGFKEYGVSMFENDKYRVEDVNRTNVIVDANGDFHVIDAYVSLADESLYNEEPMYSFIGRSGAQRLDLKERAMTRTNSLYDARRLEEMLGNSDDAARKIKLATGWERGKDGKWRYEISDKDYTYYPNAEKKFFESYPLEDEYRELSSRVNNLTNEEKRRFFEIKEDRDNALDDFKSKQGELTLDDIVDHEELFMAYPRLRGIKVVYKDMENGYWGHYDEAKNEISINTKANAAKQKSTLIHEIQHIIQSIEGFARGGNPERAAQIVKDMDNNAKIWAYKLALDEAAEQHPEHADDADALLNDILEGMTEEEAISQGWIPEENLRKQAYKIYEGRIKGDSYEKAYNQWYDKLREAGRTNYFEGSPFDLYKRLAGETEARNTQARLGMTYRERLESLAKETEDVAREDQLIMMAGDPILYSVTANEDADMGRPTMKEITTEYLWTLAQQHNYDFNEYADALSAYNQLIAETMLEMRNMRKANKLSKKTQATVERATEGAAEARKEYDKATIDKVMRLAQMLMRNGNLDNFTRGEVSRLMSAMKNATPQGSSVMDNAMKIVDVMVQHQLRDAAKVFGKQLRTKTSKLNASRVEVQAGLDLQGQHIIKVLRDAIKIKDVAEFNEKLRDAMDGMGSDSKTKSENASLDYAGLLLAKQYIESVRDNAEQEKAIKKDLKDKRAEIYDEDGKLKPEFKGKLDEEHARIKKEVQQYEQAANERLRDLRMERIDAYARLSKDLADVISGSRDRAKEWAEREMERAKEIQHNANSDLQGIPAMEQPRTRKELSFGERVAGSGLTQLLTASTRNFNEYLRFFGDKSPDGRGYLWNRFMPQVTEARDSEWANLQYELSRINTKIAELTNGKAQDVADLMAMERKMDTITVSYRDGDEITTHEMTQGEALYIYMVDKMPDGAMKLRSMGITEEDVRDIESQLDDTFLEFADWVQQDYLPSVRERYNEVHKRMFGAPMANITDYFPLKINSDSREKEEQLGVEFDKDMPSTVTGAIIARKHNNTALNLKSDAMSVLVQHIMEMEHWAAYAELSRDLGTLLSYKRFRNRAKNMSSARLGGAAKVNANGKEDKSDIFENFKKACNIVCGTFSPTSKTDEIDKQVRNIVKGVTAAKINFRLYTAAKQITSAPAFWTKAAPQDIAKNLFPILTKDTDTGELMTTWKWAIENLPGFAKRWQSRQAGNEMLDTTDTDWGIWKNKFVAAASRIGMTPNAFIDAVTVIAGSKAVFDTSFRRYKNAGYNEEEAKKKALLDASVAYNESQQSQDPTYLSIMQANRTFLNSAFSLFRNSSFGYWRNYTRAIHNIKKMSQKGYKKDTIDFLTKQAMRDGLTEEQAKTLANKTYNRQWYRSIADVALFGFVIEFAWNIAPYAVYLLGGDDGNKKREMLTDAARHSVFGSIEGIPGGNLASTFINDLMAGRDVSSFSYHLLPILSDIEKIKSEYATDKVAMANDIIGLMLSSFTGVDPRGVSDIVVAIMDACNGDPELSIGAALCIMRIAEVPQSQLDELMIDEIGMTAGEARKLPADQVAKRYANYKLHRNAPLTSWAYDDEAKQKKLTKYENILLKKAEDRLNSMSDEDMEQLFDETDDITIKSKMAKGIYTEYGLDKDYEGQKPTKSDSETTAKKKVTYQKMRTLEDVKEDAALRSYMSGLDHESSEYKAVSKDKRELDKVKELLGDKKDENDQKAMERYRSIRKKIIDKYNIEVK